MLWRNQNHGTYNKRRLRREPIRIRNRTMQPASSAGKYATDAKRGKMYFGIGFWFATDWLKEKPACCPRLLELLYRTVALSLLGR